MSYTRALKTIHLQPTDRVAQQETLDHPLFMQELVGFDPWSNPLQAYVDAYKSLDVDWIFGLMSQAVSNIIAVTMFTLGVFHLYILSGLPYKITWRRSIPPLVLIGLSYVVYSSPQWSAYLMHLFRIG